jgi:hypothetical protein
MSSQEQSTKGPRQTNKQVSEKKEGRINDMKQAGLQTTPIKPRMQPALAALLRSLNTRKSCNIETAKLVPKIAKC